MGVARTLRRWKNAVLSKMGVAAGTGGKNRKQRHLILVFHRIRETSQPRNLFDSCPSHNQKALQDILEFVARHYRVVPLREIAATAQSQEPVAVVTFDDGWRDTYDLALPVLKQLGVPATVFVTVGKIGDSKPFWQQVLGRAFSQAIEANDRVTMSTLRKMFQLGPTVELTSSLYRRLIPKLKQKTPPQLEQMFQTHFKEVVDTFTDRLFVNQAEILEMTKAGMDIGSHTMTHPLLTMTTAEQAISELTESRTQLEKIVGTTVDSIAYPNGSTNALVRQWTAECGYKLACTTQAQRFGEQPDWLALPRFEPPWDFSNEFGAQHTDTAWLA